MKSSSLTSRQAGAKEISVTKIDRLTYEQCLEELAKEGEKLEFGDDLSDSALRRLGSLHTGFYFIMDWPLKLKPFYIHGKEEDLRLSKSFDLQVQLLGACLRGTTIARSCKIAEQGCRAGSKPCYVSGPPQGFRLGHASTLWMGTRL